MKQRRDTIVLRLLEDLDASIDGQCYQGILQSSVDLRVTPNTLDSEFQDALAFAQSRKWIVGIRPEMGSVKWSITDLGRAVVIQSRMS